MIEGKNFNIYVHNTNGASLERHGQLRIDLVITCLFCHRKDGPSKLIDKCSNVWVGCKHCSFRETMEKFSILDLLHDHLKILKSKMDRNYSEYWDNRYTNIKDYRNFYT